MLASPLKQSEWKNSLGNAQISLNTVAVMFLWSHNKPEMAIFLCASSYFVTLTILAPTVIYYVIQYSRIIRPPVMCNSFSGCVVSISSEAFLIMDCLSESTSRS